MTRVEQLTRAPYTVVGWRVDDIGAAVAALLAARVSLRRFDGLAQNGDGVWTAPGGARIAWFADPDGNTLSLTQPPRG